MLLALRSGVPRAGRAIGQMDRKDERSSSRVESRAEVLTQPHSEHGVEPIRSGRSAALTGCQGVRPKRERCFLAARAGCGAATNSRHAFWDIYHFRRFWPI